MKRIASFFLAAVILCAPLSAPYARGADTPSGWAREEVARAVALGYVPAYMQGDWQQDITRAEYARLAMYFLATQYDYSAAYSLLPDRVATWYDDAVEHFVEDYCKVRTDRKGEPFDFRDYIWNYNEMTTYYGNYFWSGYSGAIVRFYDIPGLDDTADPNDLTGVISFTNDSKYIGSAYDFGLVNGRGEGIYDPTAPITRQEAAALLLRVYANYGGTISESARTSAYTDEDEIADWAAEAVAAVTALGAMQGVDDGRFDPLGHYTREQAAVAFLRLYEHAPISRARGNIPPLVGCEAQIAALAYTPNIGAFFPDWELESPFCTIQYGSYSPARHSTGPDYRLYLIYPGGGYRDLLETCTTRDGWGTQVVRSPAEHVLLSEDGTTLTFTIECPEPFRRMTDLDSAVVYHEAGRYTLEVDLATGIVTSVAPAP